MPVLESLAPNLIVIQALCDVCAVAASEVSAAVRSLPRNPQLIKLEPSGLTVYAAYTFVDDLKT